MKGAEEAEFDAHPPRASRQANPPPSKAGTPDLRSAELRLRQSLADIKVSAISCYPSLSPTGSVGSSSVSLGNMLANPVATPGAGLYLPFLNFRQTQLDIKSADLSCRIVANDFRKTLYTALPEVDNALSARERLTEQLAAAQASHDEAVEIACLYEVRYRTGTTDLCTWLEAEQTRRNTELSLKKLAKYGHA